MSIDSRGVEGDLSGHEIDMANPGKFVKLAIKQAAKGDIGEAINALHEVTRSRPDYLQAWTAKAVLYRLIGDDRMAILCSRTAKELVGKR